MSLFGQTPLRNSIAVATPKAPGDQKLFESVFCMLKPKVAKFQLPTPNSSRVVFKKWAITDTSIVMKIGGW